jgi:RimJ/RimL family protein N-acetyltransferase
MESFFTEFKATESRTENWLTEIVGPDENRILFMIDDASRTAFGCIGLASINWEKRFAEADSVIRGEIAPSGIMTRVLRTLAKWAQSQLNIQKIWVRVRSDNPATEFYQKVGFKEVKRIPLRLVKDNDIIRWVEDSFLSSDGLSVIYMVYDVV